MFNSWRLLKENNSNVQKQTTTISTKIPITTENLKDCLSGNADITFRNININRNEVLTLCYVEGLVNIPVIDEFILAPITTQKLNNPNTTVRDIYNIINDGLISHASYKMQTDINKCIDDILSGNICLIGNKENTAISFEVKGFEKRGIQEPGEENVIKGSKDSFIEVLRVNTALIRRKIRNRDLKIEETSVGNESKTNISIIYLDSKVDKEILSELKTRINKIKVDNLLTPANFDEQISDRKRGVFPQTLYTERPDKLSSNIEDR